MSRVRMRESEMGAVVVAAAAVVAIGGAAIALTYHCCHDLAANRKKGKKEKEQDQEEEQIHEQKVDSGAAEVEDQDRIRLLTSSRTKQAAVVSGDAKTSRAEVRTVEEIKARYGRPTRKDANVAAGIAAQARDKLMERGEKLAAVNDRTEQLQSDAENFASLAEELANKMKSRKWWQL